MAHVALETSPSPRSQQKLKYILLRVRLLCACVVTTVGLSSDGGILYEQCSSQEEEPMLTFANRTSAQIMYPAPACVM
jgi:hypothetical protein